MRPDAGLGTEAGPPKHTSPARGWVVMVHGAFCGGWVFETFREPFEAAGYRVLTPTLRYHDPESLGRTPRETIATVSLRDHVDDLETLLRSLIGPVVLLGHSMGGLLCQLLAARGWGDRMVLLAPSAPWGTFPTTAFEMALAQGLFFAAPFPNQPLEPSMAVAAAHALDGLPESEHQRLFRRFVPESRRVMSEILHWALDPLQASAVPAKSVTCPILALTGRGDQINPPETVRRVAARYGAAAQFEALNGHGHWLIGEPGWQNVAAMAVDWMAAQDAPIPDGPFQMAP